jgi:hypothetical protein
MSVELGYYGLDICGCCSDFIVKPQCGHLLGYTYPNLQIRNTCSILKLCCGYVYVLENYHIVVVVISYMFLLIIYSFSVTLF